MVYSQTWGLGCWWSVAARMVGKRDALGVLHEPVQPALTTVLFTVPLWVRRSLRVDADAAHCNCPASLAGWIISYFAGTSDIDTGGRIPAAAPLGIMAEQSRFAPKQGVPEMRGARARIWTGTRGSDEESATNEYSQVVFNLPWLVAQEEGLFAAEDIEVEFLRARQWAADRPPEPDPMQVDPFWRHAPFEEQATTSFNACEWGQIRRSHDTTVGGRIINLRAAIACQTIFCPSRFSYHPSTGLATENHRGQFSCRLALPHAATLRRLHGTRRHQGSASGPGRLALFRP